MDRIALVTPDDGLRKLVRGALGRAEFHVAVASPEELAKDGFSGDRCAAIILDAAGAQVSAADLVRRVRKDPRLQETPLLMVVGEEQTKLLESGDVDDFITRPVTAISLVTRLRFLLRRLGSGTPQERVVIGSLTMDFAKYEVVLHHEPLDLTYKEFELLKFLVTHPSRVYSREQLLSQVWGYDYLGGTRTVDVHIRRLRAKLGPRYSSLIHTIRNVGYKFVHNV